MNRREFVKRGSLALAGITVFRPFTANSLESIDRYIIFQQNGATLPEQAAVRELAAYLQLITGATFHTQVAADDNVPEGAIIVGPGPVAEALLPEDALDKLEPEEFLIHTKGQRLLLAGGRPRGTLYAIYHFLQEQCGVRWWTPWATTIPHHASDLRVPALIAAVGPAFEYREPSWFAGLIRIGRPATAPMGTRILFPTELGGCVKYKGFCPHVLSAGAAGQIFRHAPRVVQPHQRQAHARQRPALPLQPGAARLSSSSG